MNDLIRPMLYKIIQVAVRRRKVPKSGKFGRESSQGQRRGSRGQFGEVWEALGN